MLQKHGGLIIDCIPFISEKLSQSVIDFYLDSDRMALLKLKAKTVNFIVIQMYTLTTESKDKQIGIFMKT